MVTLNHPSQGDTNWYTPVDSNWTSIEQNLIDKSIATAKGDLIVGTANAAVARLGVGANNLVLTADSTQATGLKWASGVTPDLADAMLLKSFFSANSLLPATTFKESLYAYPSTDFANLNGGTKSVSMSRSKFTPGGTGVANWGWDAGSLKSTVLFIMGNIRARVNGVGLFMSDSLPASSEIPNNSYLIQAVPNDAGTGTAGGFYMYKRSGGALTQLGVENKIYHNNADNFGVVPVACAFYYDDSSNRLVFFIRFGNEQWYPVVDVTDSSFTTMRYFGIRNDAGTASGANQITWTGCPMAIYTN